MDSNLEALVLASNLEPIMIVT